MLENDIENLELLADEEEVDLDPWEEDDGMFVGNYRDFDPVMDVTSTTIIEDSMCSCSIAFIAFQT